MTSYEFNKFDNFEHASFCFKYDTLTHIVTLGKQIMGLCLSVYTYNIIHFQTFPYNYKSPWIAPKIMSWILYYRIREKRVIKKTGINSITPTDLYDMFQIKVWTIPF